MSSSPCTDDSTAISSTGNDSKKSYFNFKLLFLTALSAVIIHYVYKLYEGDIAGSWPFHDNEKANNGIDGASQNKKLFSRSEINKSSIFPGSNPSLLHGIVGVDDSGKPMWDPLLEKVKEKFDFGFQKEISDFISLNRPTTPMNHELCQNKSFDIDALSDVDTTVVMIFHNEPSSVLLRSIHSILNYTEPSLLREIIVVNDGSTYDTDITDELTLEDYMRGLPKTRLINLEKRLGIVSARLKGIDAVTSPTFMVLDSHIEVTAGWLPPLLQAVKENPMVLIIPQIFGIDNNSFQHNNSGIGCRVELKWFIQERPHAVEENFTTEYVNTVAMSGGLFLTRKDTFMHFGGYDKGLKGWGAENIELSLRYGMCGGTVLCSMCSKIHHIFRNRTSYKQSEIELTRNRLRIAASWLDEWGEVTMSILEPQKTAEYKLGSISDNLKTREMLNCKPFSWFMKNIYSHSYISDLSNLHAVSRIQSIMFPDLCVSMGGARLSMKPFKMENCNKSLISTGFLFIKKADGFLRIETANNSGWCLGVDGLIAECYTPEFAQNFSVTDEGQIRWKTDDENYLCMTLTDRQADKQLSFLPCDSSQVLQLWKWKAFIPQKPDWSFYIE